jgi:hypothetical protein
MAISSRQPLVKEEMNEESKRGAKGKDKTNNKYEVKINTLTRKEEITVDTTIQYNR